MEQLKRFGMIFRTYLWRPTKALLCVVQFYVCISAMDAGVRNMLATESTGFRAGFFLVCSVVLTVIALGLAAYYDSIDDKTFLAFCDEEEPVKLTRRPLWLISAGVLAVGVAPGLGHAFTVALHWAGVYRPWMDVVCVILAFALVGGVRFWQMRSLYNKWVVQAEIQKRAQTAYPSGLVRFGQSAVMFFAMVVLAYFGAPYSILLLLSTFNIMGAFFTVFDVVAASIVTLFVTVWVVRRIRRLTERRRFLDRLREMQKKGEISFETEGHPYLSIFSPRAYFGLKITDLVRAADKDIPHTYLVSVVNFQKRRLSVNLRENHVVQIAHEIRLRMGPASMMMARYTQGKLSQPVHTWYTSFATAFPEGEGERILILDPAPYLLQIWEGHRKIEGDNGSKVYDYTVWTKNAFANFVERT